MANDVKKKSPSSKATLQVDRDVHARLAKVASIRRWKLNVAVDEAVKLLEREVGGKPVAA